VTYREQGFEKIDFMLIGWMVFTVILVGAVHERIPESREIMTQHATWAFVFIGLLRVLHRFKVPLLWRYVFRILAIIAALPITFYALRPIITTLHPVTYEVELLAFDRGLFGIDPLLYMERWLHPLAVDFFSIAYFSYFTLTFIALPPLLAARDIATTDRILMSVMFSIFMCYLGYMIVPARSPYVVAELPGLSASFDYSVPVTGWIIGDTIRSAIDSWDTVRLNAFPSGHAAVAIAFFLAVRRKKVLFPIMLVNGLVLVFSTIYLRYHYVIDVIAGAIIAVTAVLFAEWWSDHPLEKNEKEVVP